MRVVMDYSPAIPLVIWALCVTAGLDPGQSLVPFLVCEAFAVIIYIRNITREMQHRQHRRHGERH